MKYQSGQNGANAPRIVTVPGKGGTKSRFRKILRRNSPKGKPCPPLQETVSGCNQNKPCPILCETGVWSDWSNCSVECGDGVETRSREVTRPPAHGAPPCPDLTQERPCYRQRCTQDCVVSKWSAWSECNGSCTEQGTQLRTRLVEQSPANSTCPDLYEERACMRVKGCGDQCVFSAWSPWSACSKACGKGEQIRTRTSSCPDQPPESLAQSRACNTQPCDCAFSDWSNWSECSAACGLGHQNRTRTAQDCQAPLSELEQTRSCLAKACTTDCALSPWSEWSECSVSSRRGCGQGTSVRSRSVTVLPSSEGAACGALTDFRDCLVACQVTEADTRVNECRASAWSEWSSCSVPCGTGTRTRSRTLLSAGDEPDLCGPLTQIAACVGAQGLCPQDCTVTDWSPWSECSSTCGTGYKTRQRFIAQMPTDNGQNCPPLQEYRECNPQPCPQDCLISDWSEWSDCDATCATQGKGSQARSRQITRPAERGGHACPAESELTETRECSQLNTLDCEALLCRWGDWSPWSPCSKDCGPGEMKKLRLPSANEPPNPSFCRAPIVTAPCYGICAEDCQVTDWTAWSECDAECGGGDRFRSRGIRTLPANGGEPCPTLLEIEACNEQPCLAEMNDCQMTEWTEWTTCSKSCGGGIMSRTREIVRGPVGGGSECGATKERRGCNLERCKELPCEDNPRILAGGITCQILKAQGCGSNLHELATRHGVELPEDVPPEARVQDACPATCGVCEECAPGCQLRDLGNSICSQACNNEACDFDRGDCGGDCDMPSNDDFLFTPPLKAMNQDQVVLMSCAAQDNRIKGREALKSIEIICDQKTARALLDPKINLQQLACRPDPCPFLRAQNFPPQHALYNGVYERDTLDESSNSRFVRRLKSRELALFSAEDQVAWKVYDFGGIFPAYTSDRCSRPAIRGEDLSLDCATGAWISGEGDRAEGIILECLTQRPPTPPVIDPKSKQEVMTKLRLGEDTESPGIPVRCEDMKIVERLSGGFSCQKIKESLGCSTRLRDTGKEIPATISSETTVATVCPDACGLCEQCSPGCAIWFVGNHHCDPLCNNEPCGFDGGDCENYQPAPALEPALDRELAIATSATGPTQKPIFGVDSENCEDDSTLR